MIVSIIGCGWLGFALAQKLIAEGHYVKGSTRSESKLSTLREAGIDAFYYSDSQGKKAENASLFECGVLVINIPPGSKDHSKLIRYPKLIKQISRDPGIKKIIFISSTGVYAATNSESNENSLLDNSVKAISLIEAEKCIQEKSDYWIILRLAGLAGPGREPGRWFSGKTELKGGETPVNMVHREDCIAIITKLLDSDINKEIFNVCADQHPDKQSFYRVQAQKLKLDAPVFLKNKNDYKIVDNSKIKKHLNYEFRYSDPLSF